MKKWIFIVGIFACSILFFISGTLVGYLKSEKNIQTEIEENNRPTRKPSKHINPIIGRIVDRQVIRLKTKTRIPTPNAVVQANRFRSMATNN